MRPRVLVSAFACNPYRGSEPGLGFHYVRALAHHCDLTVVTEEIENRDALESFRETDAVFRSVRFVYLPWPRTHTDGSRDVDGNLVSYYGAYNRWQKLAQAAAVDLLQSEPFDLLHQLTMTGYREPGYLWNLNKPFVWGPVGGFVMMPWRFLPALGMRGAAQCGLRNVLNWVQSRFSPRVRKAISRAEIILASTTVDFDFLKAAGRGDVILLGENGASDIKAPVRRPRDPNETLVLSWSGLHVPRKGLRIALHALKRIPDRYPVRLDILGAGPDTQNCRALANTLGVAHRCRFHGWLKRENALKIMLSADALLLTSLQDATTAVLFEAMVAGLPIIAHSCCGFQDALTEDCALLIPLVSPAVSYQGFAAAIIRLCTDPLLCERLSRGARERAVGQTWERRASIILDSYRKVLNRYATAHSSS